MSRKPEPETFEYSIDGLRAAAGKTDRDNEILSLKTAKAKDWWFHVKGMPGSHVILFVEDQEPSKEILKKTAAIAAWHSKAKNAGTIAVSCTRAMNVRKPRGAKTGTVTISKQITLKVRPELP